MKWFKERRETFADTQSYWGVLLAIGFALLGFIGEPIINAISSPSEEGSRMIMGAPIWAWGLILGMFCLAWWAFENMVRMRRYIKGARKELSQLREKGVELRNNGRHEFKDESSWLTWQSDVEAWNQDVIAALSKINEADATWFSVLDVVPPKPRLSFYKNRDETDLHERLYRFHDERLNRLGQMIRDLWRGS